MPGPRKQNGKKRKPTAPISRAPAASAPTTSTIPEGFFADIDNSASWMSIVGFLCEYFELPDLGTRHGLKKVHSDFNKIHKKLDAAYVGAQRRNLEKLMGGIVGIWAKMCADSILRDKLFKEGLLARIMPVLEYNSTRHMGLNALSLVTHHGGESARREIARKNSVLVKLIEDHPDDLKVLELATATMAHSTSAVLGVSEAPDKNLIKAIQVRAVLKVTVENMRKPMASHYMMEHAFGLLTDATQHCPEDCKAVPSMLTLLVAALRSASLPTRCRALCGLIRYTMKDSEMDLQIFDPRQIVAHIRRGFPKDQSDILMEYGPERCDTTIIVRCMIDYQKMMMRVAQDHDLLKLGTSLAELIQRTEFAISEGYYQAEDENGRLETLDVGLPFKMWTDALPHCASALRARGTAADLDAADVLDLKFRMIRGRTQDTITLGQRAIERNPELAYAYYAISIAADHDAGLRAAKKGLRCRRATPFLRAYMLWRAVEHAGDLGITTLQDVHGGKNEQENAARGVAFLMSAWEDAKTFIAEASPESRQMLPILNWYIILTIAIKGPELSEDLRELAPARHKLDMSARFMNTLGFTIKRTQLRLARELVLSLYPKALAEWGPLIARFDELDDRADVASTLPSAEQADEDLAAWLEDVRLDDEGEANGNGNRNRNGAIEEETHARRCTHPKISMNSVALYRCAWCGNPSAMLRKCGGCGQTKYCDGQCQKKHWSEHKHSCKK